MVTGESSILRFGKLLLLSSALYAAQATAADPASSSISVKKYSLDLSLDPVHGTVTGSVTIDFLQQGGSPLKLDMAQALTVRSLTLDGQPAAYTHDQDAVTVTAVPGAHRLTIRYDGQPAPRRLRFDTDAQGEYAASYGLPYSAMQWWPDFDDPSIKAQSADIGITVPDTLMAASNGRLVEVTPLPGHLRRYHWTESYPIYPDVISVAVAPYV